LFRTAYEIDQVFERLFVLYQVHLVEKVEHLENHKAKLRRNSLLNKISLIPYLFVVEHW
jgi:hypothetical protein